MRLAITLCILFASTTSATAQITCTDWDETAPEQDPHPALEDSGRRLNQIVDAGDFYVVGGYDFDGHRFFVASYSHDTGERISETGLNVSFDSMIHRPGCLVLATLSAGYTVIPISDDGVLGHGLAHTVGDYCQDVAPLGDNLAVMAAWTRLAVVDLSDPAAPQTLVLIPSVYSDRVTVDGHMAYAAYDNGLAVIDLSTPDAPEILSLSDLPGPPVDLDVDHPNLAVSCIGAGVAALNVADPHDPVLVGTVETLGQPTRIEVVDDHAYAMVRDAVDPGGPSHDALLLVDLEAPAPLMHQGYFGICGEAVNVQFWHHRIAWIHDVGALDIFIPQCPTVVAAPEVPAGPRLMPPYPNPFNPTTNLVFTLDQPGEVSLTVHGLDGKLVARLCDGLRESGRHAFRWDGRGQDGHRVASGTYVARLEMGDAQQSVRLTLVK